MQMVKRQCFILEFPQKNKSITFHLILRRKFRINTKDIVKMHSMLVKDMEIPEGFKKVPNFIVGGNVQTTPPEHVEKEISKLVEWINVNPEKFHPLQLAARSHGKFEKIHPFEDGNGRVGRFLINVLLMDRGYPPLIIRKTKRVSYINSLEEFDSNHPQNLDRFILERYKETFRKFFEVYVLYVKNY